MNWDAVGAFGQMLGSIAVFVTLGYLAVQVGHARREVRRSVSQGRTEATLQLMLNRVNNERSHGLRVKAETALGGGVSPFRVALVQTAGLSQDEADTLGWEESAWWQLRAQTITYIDELPAGARSEFDTNVYNYYGASPVPKLWYETTKGVLNPDAVRYIDNLLAQPG